MQRDELIKKFALALPGLDKPITMQKLNGDTERRLLSSRRLSDIETTIRYKVLEFERVSGKKARYVIMDETTHIEMTSLDRWANPYKAMSLTPMEIKHGVVSKFDYMDVIVVHDRGRGIQIGC